MPTAICPECDEEVYVDADSEQGDVVACDECGVRLVVVGLDPIELDVDIDDADDEFDDPDDFDDFDFDDSERF
jgi:alpha-aminoadipate carrier protein LysW